MTLSAINNRWEVLCHQSIHPKYSAFLPAQECSAIPNTWFIYPRKLLCSAGLGFCSQTLFVHVSLFSIPRQQFGRSWMNTKVMRWRFMHPANIWQGQFCSCLSLLPAKSSDSLTPEPVGFILTCRMWENMQREVNMKRKLERFSSWREPNSLIFWGILLAHTKKPADILEHPSAAIPCTKNRTKY